MSEELENTTESIDTNALKGMKAQVEAAFEEFGITDSKQKQIIIAKVISDFANPAREAVILDKAVSKAFKKGIAELSVWDRFKWGWPTAVSSGLFIVGGLVALNSLGGSNSNEKSATETTANNSDPFSSTEPTRATPRPIKSASL